MIHVYFVYADGVSLCITPNSKRAIKEFNKLVDSELYESVCLKCIVLKDDKENLL